MDEQAETVDDGVMQEEIEIPDPAPQEAPWGYRKDGKPKSKPGARSSSAKSSPPPPRKSTSSSRKDRDAAPDFRPVIHELIGVPVFLLGMFCKATGDDAWAADAATLAIHSPRMADAVNQVAQQRPEIAAVLVKLMAINPWAALFSAFVPVTMQIAANHGKIPVVAEMGLRSKDDLFATIQMMGQQAP